MDNGRVLAVDYGTKRVGTALSDPMRIIAAPYKTLENNSSLLPALLLIVNSQGVTEIVVGMPAKESGEEAALGKAVAAFAQLLRGTTGLPVALLDERYTSVIAEQRILGGGLKKSKRRQKGLVDVQAATVLLEDYLRMQQR